MPTAVDLLALSPGQLRATFNLDSAPAASLPGIAGQERAREAIAFGLSMDADGYNIAVSGPPQSGRNQLVREELTRVAAPRPPVPDWVYVFNFADPRRPRAISLPPAMGDDLKREMADLAAACKDALPAAFASDSYEARTHQALDPIQKARERTLEALQESARQLGYIVNATPMGWMATPVKADGTPMEADEFTALGEAERQPIEARGEEVQKAIAAAMRGLRQLDVEARQRLLTLDREITRFVVGPILDDVQARFAQYGLLDHFAAIEKDIVANLDAFKRFTAGFMEKLPPQLIQQFTDEREALLQRYSVNLFITHGDELVPGAPVIDERHPSYLNLFGRVEFENRMGTLVTDFLHIRPGAIHLANGGYLILQAAELFSDPRSWPRLKRALKTREVRFDDPAEGLPFPLVNLAPEGLPLGLKVVLVGPPMLFALLDYVDPDFPELFKIRAEFEPDTPADADALATYAAFVRRTQEACALRPFEPDAVTELLQFGSRLAGRQDRLSTRLGLVGDLCQEADHNAGAAGSATVEASNVRAAVAARERRSGLIPDRIRRMIAEGTLRIDTAGAVVGQVNGLAVFSTGGHAFGAPTRITCRTSTGRRGVVAVERETERSGAIHTKGVLVLDGYIAGTFGASHPLAFNASLTFEQSYDEVEGDSASSAELYAILTSLAGVPVRQDIAVTGSVDQFGNVQAVGGVTEKVEGYFDVCREVGLSGTQGVVIPATNVVNLTLRDDIVQAVAEGRFHLWAVRRVEEGIELLTGIPAGTPGAFATYPEGSLFARVAARLDEMRTSAVAPDPDGDARNAGDFLSISARAPVTDGPRPAGR
ncbi:MAG: Lon protease family protein [Dehalococcoidia bacterium]